MYYTVKVVIALLISAVLLTACIPAKKTDTGNQISKLTVGIANPASVNCEKVGGVLDIQKKGDGGEYGVCVFEDNRQCEEWALMRGECPLGGRKITGYVTEAAKFCAITGGEYNVTGNDKNGEEQGTCTKHDKTCDVHDYYNGKCDL